MQYKKILSKIGLSEDESTIYLDLLKNGLSSIMDISNRTGLHRPLIYKILPNLIETNLIGEIVKGKRKIYKAESPAQLKNLFDNLSKSFSYMIPELEDLYETSDSKPSIKILEGKKGIKYIFEDIVYTLKKGETYYRYSSRRNFENKLVPSKYNELKEKKQIQRLVISSEIYKTKKQYENEIVKIPKHFDLFDDNFTKLIYGNKVAIIDYNTMSSFIVENKLLAKFEEKLFKILYKFLKNIQE